MTWDVGEFEFLTRDGPSELTGSSFLREVARGNVTGASAVSAYGERTTTGAETNRLIWPNGEFSIPAASGVQMTLVSTSADDDVGGTGIETVHIHYLDGSLNPNTETVSLDGLTSVTTDATDIRFIQCMHIGSVGSGGAAAGDITASNGGTVYSQISTGEVRCSSSARMVPAGKRLLVTGAAASAVSGTSTARVIVRIVATSINNHEYIDPLVLVPQASIGVQDGSEAMGFDPPLMMSEGNIMGMAQTTDKAATISGSWFGIYEDDE